MAIRLSCVGSEFMGAITAKDESKIQEMISPQIVFITNRETLGAQGESEYLARIREMWEKTIEYKYSAYKYRELDNKLEITFEQICVVKEGDQNVVLLKRGMQTLDFDHQKIVEIYEEENVTSLSEQEYAARVAKIHQQKARVSPLCCCSIL